VSIISLSVSTICSISSFVFCSVHGTFIKQLRIQISNVSSRQISSFLLSPCFASIQCNTPKKCFHHTFLQVKAEGSSHEVSFLVESLFSQSNSPSYFVTTSTVFGHQTSEVTKLFHSFQILFIDCDLHSSSFYRRHFHNLSFFVLILILYFSDVSCSVVNDHEI